MCGSVLSLAAGLLGTKSSKASTPTVSVAPTITSGTEALEASNAAKRKAGAAEGYQSTIKTSSSGDTSTATTNKKTLLGG
jgi:hypothetical protein